MDYSLHKINFKERIMIILEKMEGAIFTKDRLKITCLGWFKHIRFL